MDCDLLILGGGPGGHAAALHAAGLGGRVVLIERDRLGGTCLNRGCIPTKALLHASEFIARLRKGGAPGARDIRFELDPASMQAEKNAVVSRLRRGVQGSLKAAGVQVVRGEGVLAGAGRISVKVESATTDITARRMIVASGSSAIRMGIPGVENTLLMTSDEALGLTDIPSDIVVVGGGYIGLEFACHFANLGVKVTIVEMTHEILPRMDSDVQRTVRKALTHRGISILTDARVTGAAHGLARVERAGEPPLGLPAGKVLVAVGRKPLVEGLGLDVAGVSYSRGGIKVDAHLRTTAPSVYAVGDATGGLMLAHRATAQGMAAASCALGGTVTQDLCLVPACLYSDPQVACVGITEEEARAAGLDIAVARHPMAANPRALIEGGAEGLVKIVHLRRHGEILGVHIVGPHATELIAEAALAMRLEATVAELATTIHAHPTLSESLMEAARGCCGAVRGQTADTGPESTRPFGS